jgi:hypothetical protein
VGPQAARHAITIRSAPAAGSDRAKTEADLSGKARRDHFPMRSLTWPSGPYSDGQKSMLPPGPAGMARLCFFGSSATMASVVMSRPTSCDLTRRVISRGMTHPGKTTISVSALQPPIGLDTFSYLSCVFWARSASVSHRSAISMKNDLCAEVRAASANRMHSAALLRN